IRFKAVDLAKGQFAVVNRHDFIDLSGFAFGWKIERDGKQVASGELPGFTTAPGATDSFTLALPTLPEDTGARDYLTFVATPKAGTVALLDTDHELAWDQFALSSGSGAKAQTLSGAAPQVADSDSQLRISGNDFEIDFDKNSGEITRWTQGGAELLQQGIRPNLWRAPTDNDSGGDNWMLTTMGDWKTLNNSAQLVAFEHNTLAGAVQVSVSYQYGELASYRLDYRILNNGELLVDNHFEVSAESAPNLPRLGVNLVLPGDYSQFSWFGRGPLENYPDRKTGYPMGRYQSTVAEQYHDYSRPQETGNKTDVHWLTLLNSAGKGIQVSADTPLNVSALPVLLDDLDHDRGNDQPNVHGGAIEFRDIVSLNLDHQIMGVGGSDSWGARPLGKYMVPAKNYRFSFRISPFDASQQNAVGVSRVRYPQAGTP
ncbi:MAG: DUF4981 domain-containing protein, partial [Porticoccaceae bacterium]|nr:DUF4981 domain-containing protein [Porticoccaceae bacterium]